MPPKPPISGFEGSSHAASSETGTTAAGASGGAGRCSPPPPPPSPLYFSSRAPGTLDDVIEFVLPYLSVRDCCALKATSTDLAISGKSHSPENLTIVKNALSSKGPSLRVFETYGNCLLNLSLHRVPFVDKMAFPTILALCHHLRRLSLDGEREFLRSIPDPMASSRTFLRRQHSIVIPGPPPLFLYTIGCDWNWDDGEAALAIGQLKELTEPPPPVRRRALRRAESVRPRHPALALFARRAAQAHDLLAPRRTLDRCACKLPRRCALPPPLQAQNFHGPPRLARRRFNPGYAKAARDAGWFNACHWQR